MKHLTHLKGTILASLLAIALPASAESPCAPPPPRPAGPAGHHGPAGLPPVGQPMPPYLHGLTLSEAQQDRIYDHLNEQAKYVRERMRTVEKTDKILMAVGFSPDYDETRIRELIETNVEAKAQLEFLRIRTDHLIQSLLTPEQRKQVELRPMQRPPMPPMSAQNGGPGPGHPGAVPRPSPID